MKSKRLGQSEEATNFRDSEYRIQDHHRGRFQLAVLTPVDPTQSETPSNGSKWHHTLPIYFTDQAKGSGERPLPPYLTTDCQVD
jgi:hypothetical protein